MVTPNFKRKYPAESCQRLSSKKRRSVGHNMGPEMLPNSLFNISLTPGSGRVKNIQQCSSGVQISISAHLLQTAMQKYSVQTTLL